MGSTLFLEKRTRVGGVAVIELLRVDISIAVRYFSTDLCTRKLPFISRFPKDSCEVVSALLAAALAEKYPGNSFICMHGINSTDHSSHFWIEMHGVVVDPTIHQFEGFYSAWVGMGLHPFIEKYTEIQSKTINEALYELTFLNVDRVRQDFIINELISAMNQ